MATRTGSVRRRFGVCIALVAVATAVGIDPAVGADAPAGELHVREKDVSTDASYWTPARLSAATEVDLPEVGAGDRSTMVDGGGSRSLSLSRIEPTRAPRGLRPFSLTDEAVRVRRPYTNMPDRTVGRVFFTDERGRNRTCTGVAVASANKSVVWTAGHCVESGAFGGFHTNWIFIPGYGSCGKVCRPFGGFRATKLMTTQGWADDGDFRADVGAAVVAPVGGRKLTSTLGGQGLMFGGPGDEAVRAIGYPADPPFEGFRQWMCLGATTGVDAVVAGQGPNPVAISCNLSGGASGGPWLVEVGRNGYGYVTGHTSYRYRRDRGTVYSPVLDEVAAELYHRASTAKVRG